MAERGTPLPIATRLKIREEAAATSQRQAAKTLGVARETVRKYAPKGAKAV